MDIAFKLTIAILSCGVLFSLGVSAWQLISIRKGQDQGEAAQLLKQAFSSTGASTSGQYAHMEELTGLALELSDAGLPMSAKTWRLLQIAASLTCGCAAWAITCSAGQQGGGAGISGLIACAAAVVVFFAFKKALKRRVEKRRLLLEKQLAHMEIHIAENSRVGLSASRSILACVELADEPLKGHLQRLYNEITYSNLSLGEGFMNMAKRTESNDVRTLAEVITIQQQTGSNLADAMMVLHETISRRLEMRQTLKSSLAETKITRSIVAVTPWAIFALLAFAPVVKINGFWDFYSTNPLGWIVLGVCIVIEALILALIARLSNLKLD